MPEPCGRTFDEAQLSGYLDDALTQADEQRVRIHLEDCVACRGEVDEWRALRATTLASTFRAPTDDEWRETPRTSGSRIARRFGWTLALAWAAGMAGVALYGAWLFLAADGPWLPRVLVVAVWTGGGLLLLSVLLDRLNAMKTDRYREVRR
jgi:anti-sigma factor RsiW